MNRAPYNSRMRRQSGFNTVELVITVIIISILVLIAVPIVQNRAQQARIAAAQSDLEHLTNAQARVATDIGYIVRMFMLDDVFGGDGLPPGHPDDRIDGLNDLRGAPAFIYVINSDNMYINPSDQEFIQDGDTVLNQLIATETNFSSVASVWRGPYVNVQRDSVLEDAALVTPTTPLPDIPDDPWGNDYQLYLATGRVEEPQGNLLQTTDERIFGQPTIVSYGPDGILNLTGDSDDLIRGF